MAKREKSTSLTAAVSEEIKANFNLDKFKEKGYTLIRELPNDFLFVRIQQSNIKYN